MIAGPLPDYPFRRTSHDRLAERRTDAAFLSAAWKDPKTRVLVVQDGKLATDVTGDRLRFVSPDQAPPGDRLLLGSADGTVFFLVLPTVDPAGACTESSPDARLSTVATNSPASETTPVEPADRFSGLRQLAGHVDEASASLAVHAVALAHWHVRHPRCSQCGAATVVADAGAFRRCPSCEASHFPRTDPAVIMLVTDEADRCLLGHNRVRPTGWFSTLAGFVEPGESPEQAVAREVLEEVGVVVGGVRYAGSQPWPFPSSLMLGYFAAASSTEVTVDGDEIDEARWFTRPELAAAVTAGGVGVPTTLSIARALLTAWYGAPLPANVLTL